MARDTYYDAGAGSGSSTGSKPATPRTGTRSARFSDNNAANANHGASPAPDRIGRFNEQGDDTSARVPGAAR